MEDKKIDNVVTVKPDRRVADKKSVWESKTIWANLLAIVVFIVQDHFGYAVPPDVQVQILAAINIGLRFITKHDIKW